jgi:hypothetical protein
VERFLRWLDDVDDFLAVMRLQAGPVAVTLALLAIFLAALGVVFVLGPPDLLAAP